MFEVIDGGKIENQPTDLTDAHFNIYDNGETKLVVFDYIYPGTKDRPAYDYDVMKDDLLKLFGDQPLPEVQPLDELDNVHVMPDYRSGEHPVYLEDLHACRIIAYANIEIGEDMGAEDVINQTVDLIATPIVDPDIDVSPEDFYKPFQVQVTDANGKEMTVTRKRTVLGGLSLSCQAREYPYEDMKEQLVDHLTDYLNQVLADHENIAYIRLDVAGYIAKDVWGHEQSKGE